MRRIIYTLLVLLFISCNNKTKESGESINIMIDPSKSEMKDYNEITEKTTFIQLETTSECLVKYIHKLTIYNNRIYVFTSDYNGKLYCFDMHGKFLFPIGSRGMGPGEYIYMTDFSLDRKNKCLWLGDNYNKILKYDLNGKFIQQYKTEFSIRNLIPLQDNIFAIRLGYYKDKDYSFVIYSISDDKILYYKKAMNDVDKIIAKNAFFQDDKNILYNGGFNDTIFKIKDASLEPYYVVNFGKSSFSNKSSEDNNHKNLLARFLKPDDKYAGLIENMNEEGNYLRFAYTYAGSGQMSIYAKDKNKTLNLKELSFHGKKYDVALYFFKFQENNKLISFLPSYLLTENEHINNTQRYGSYSDYSLLISNLRAEDNPVLIFSNAKFEEMFNSQK